MQTAKRSSKLNCFYKTLLCFGIYLVIADIIMLWIVIKPVAPSFQLNSVTVSSLNTTADGELTATFDVAVNLLNPNADLTASCESLELTVWFGHLAITSGTVGRFWIGPNSEVPVRTRFGVDRKLFPRGMVNGVAEQKARGYVDFRVTLLARVRFWWHHIVHTRVRSFTFECYPLNVVFPIDDNNSGTGSFVTPYEL
ncbi:hypothetical protein Fmac_027388 [Flemingia macrophylla]|uniref:Late embryogenesis abundant protein LEA-2 subgroup domain-containing protein n=1 Tax=Flemingia macrophylla TaxID=520843 RepID=A0ABD1LHJ8_9FABA